MRAGARPGNGPGKAGSQLRTGDGVPRGGGRGGGVRGGGGGGGWGGRRIVGAGKDVGKGERGFADGRQEGRGQTRHGRDRDALDEALAPHATNMLPFIWTGSRGGMDG